MARTWATVKDLAKQYQLSENTVRNKVNSGEWPADRIGQGNKRKLIRFSPEQQEEIELKVRHGSRQQRKSGWLNEALTKISA